TVYAAQASFFIVIAAFPFIMLLLALIQMNPAVSKSDLMRILTRLLPEMLHSLVIGIVDDLYIKYPGRILSVTALLALWSASRGMMGIERGLNRIYGSMEKRNYLVTRLICSVYTLVFMIACMISLTLLVLGNSIQSLVLRYVPVLSGLIDSVINIRAILSGVLFMLVFVGLYTFVPQKKQHPKHQIPGAAFSTVGWMIFSYGFSVYFTYFSNFSYMYGSLTGIVLLMMWLYFCICILFLGAEINCLIERSIDFRKSLYQDID
ncbi:MAG: YihY/virulence factor BrkB family protein, partial [Clostridiales bacterium]|nr:YihY/virulence factor BrkB family protein [Clostridiales bacterium]